MTYRAIALVWECIGSLLKSGNAIIPRVIYEEIEAKEDGLFDWVKGHKYAIADADGAVIDAVKQIMQTHGKLVKEKKNRSGGDPWVIAHALVSSGTVVTEENAGGNDPKIPDVCESLGVPHMRTLEMLRVCGFHA